MDPSHMLYHETNIYLFKVKHCVYNCYVNELRRIFKKKVAIPNIFSFLLQKICLQFTLIVWSALSLTKKEQYK